MTELRSRLRETLTGLMQIPGLSGHEDRVRRRIRTHLDEVGISSRTDRLGNLIATVAGAPPDSC